VSKNKIGNSKKITYIRPVDFARRERVSRARVHQWIQEGRIPVYRPAPGIVLIDETTPRPVNLSEVEE